MSWGVIAHGFSLTFAWDAPRPTVVPAVSTDSVDHFLVEANLESPHLRKVLPAFLSTREVSHDPLMD